MRNLTVAILSSLALAMAIVPGTALANPTPATWGWVTARKPTTTNYNPAARDQGNSAGMTNTVQRVDVGHYNVVFPGIDSSGNGGTAIITALGSQPRFCIQGDIGQNSTEHVVTIYVVCYGFDGEQADTAFSVVYQAGGAGSGALAYLWADQQSTTDYSPQTFYQYNSTGPDNTVHRFGTGSYQVSLPNMAAGEGDIQVTTASDANCRVVGWSSGTNALLVNVKCYSPQGILTDERYDLLYTDKVGMTGVSRPSAVYLFANQPTTSLYTPAPAYRYSTGMAPSVKRIGTGAYIVKLPSMPNGGAASVTAVGTSKSRCQLSSISTTTPQKVGVLCFKPDGTPIDSKFTFGYTK